jgi:large repetitive protein
MAIINGSLDDDVLIGTDGLDFIYGAIGDDYIWGGGGNDNLDGGGGNDFIDGGDGNNTISYLDYVAPWYVSGLIGLYVDLAAGTGTSFVESYNPNSDPNNLNETDAFINIQNVIGSNSNDWISGDGNSNWLYGG